jgi:hypothetical protein
MEESPGQALSIIQQEPVVVQAIPQMIGLRARPISQIIPYISQLIPY